MSYRWQTASPIALGAEEKFDYAGTAEKCAAAAKGDWETKSGREQATKSAANCSAEAACAYFTGGASAAIPGGLCGKIGEELATAAITLWNSVFGDDEEEAKRREKARQKAAFLVGDQKIYELDKLLEDETYLAAQRLVEFHDQQIPELKGDLGILPHQIQPAYQLLHSFGAPMETVPKLGTLKAESFYGQWISMVCNPTGGPPGCYKPTSTTIQSWLGSVAQAVKLGLGKLGVAQDKARAAVIAKEAAYRAREKSISIDMKELERLETRARLRRIAGAMLLAAGAGGAAYLLFWKGKS